MGPHRNLACVWGFWGFWSLYPTLDQIRDYRVWGVLCYQHEGHTQFHMKHQRTRQNRCNEERISKIEVGVKYPPSLLIQNHVRSQHTGRSKLFSPVPARESLTHLDPGTLPAPPAALTAPPVPNPSRHRSLKRLANCRLHDIRPALLPPLMPRATPTRLRRPSDQRDEKIVFAA